MQDITLKCEGCGLKFEVNPICYDETNYCTKCGVKYKKEQIEPDPWLIPGWPYEVWDNHYSLRKKLNYFKKLNNNRESHRFGLPEFVTELIHIEHSVTGYIWDNYRPLNTPLDFAPDWATHIEINEDYNKNMIFRYISIDKDIKFEWLLWKKCSEQLKGKTLPIPNWARRNC